MSRAVKAFEENRAICESIDDALNTLDHAGRETSRKAYRLLEILKRDPDKARRLLNGR